jgi:chemotaxis protein MotA
LTKLIDDEHAYYHVLRVVMLSFLKGMSPAVAVEVARRAVPEHVRPSFKEVEQACRQKDGAAASAAA